MAHSSQHNAAEPAAALSASTGSAGPHTTGRTHDGPSPAWIASTIRPTTGAAAAAGAAGGSHSGDGPRVAGFVSAVANSGEWIEARWLRLLGNDYDLAERIAYIGYYWRARLRWPFR